MQHKKFLTQSAANYVFYQGYILVNGTRTFAVVSGFKKKWAQYWMRRAGLHRTGRIATRLATLAVPPYKAGLYLADLNPKGFISPKAMIYQADLRLGKNVYIGDRVLIYSQGSGIIEFGDRVQLYSDIHIEAGPGGTLVIGEETHIQPRCQIMPFAAPISIGRKVEIAPNCAFYPYDHGFALGEPIMNQPLKTKGGIVVGDEAWLGFGVTVLSGVRIGNGAVVGAGSVVTKDVPDNSIAAGVPARVIGVRN